MRPSPHEHRLVPKLKVKGRLVTTTCGNVHKRHSCETTMYVEEFWKG